MRLTRVYVEAPLESGAQVTLSGGAAGHLTRVLRLGPGAAVTLFNGQGGEYLASIERVHGARVTVAVGAHQPIERESPFPLTLAQGVSRGERMDLVVQKATELGVARLVPVLTERSIVRLDEEQSERKSSHWRAIAIAACEPSATRRIEDVPRPAGGATVLIGPEGGLSDEEQAAAQAAGFTAVNLGPRVLRTETAAIATLTLLQREFGDL